MASPAAYEDKKSDSKKILFRFCSECSNLLFPREDKANNRLLFACRTCSFTEEAPSSCVMRHEISQAAGDTAGITQDVGQDPTVGLSRSLSRTSLSEDIGPGLCTMCGQEVFCVECGEEPVPGVWLEAPDPDGFEEDAQEVIEEEDEEEIELPRIQKPCPSCGENEAVFFQSQQRTADTGMKLYYVCTTCGNVWQEKDK